MAGQRHYRHLAPTSIPTRPTHPPGMLSVLTPRVTNSPAGNGSDTTSSADAAGGEHVHQYGGV